MRRKNVENRLIHRRSRTFSSRDWPSFYFDVEEANSEFVEEVKKAVRAFSFAELGPSEQRLFRLVKKYGADEANQTLLAVIDEIRKEDPDKKLIGAEMTLTNLPGYFILNKIPGRVRERLLPYNDVWFCPIHDYILVNCRSLIQVGQGKKAFFHSRHEPTVEVDGKRLVVAFTRHAIANIKERINPRWRDYLALGDVFAFLNDCLHFEQCIIRNLQTKAYDQKAVSFFDTCGSKLFWHWRTYVNGMLGTYDPDKGKPFYRVGYCPVFPDGNFLKLGTLLVPGYKDTPEYAKLMDSTLSDEKNRLALLATGDNAANHTSINDSNVPALKWFHENGIPQVIQTKDRLYKRMKDEFIISDVIEK